MAPDPAPFAVLTDPRATETLLRLRGRVDRDAEPPLLEAFDTATADGATRVVLDLSGTTYINSSGLASIVALLGHARASDVAIAARGLSDHYRHVFEITRLSDLIELEPTETSR